MDPRAVEALLRERVILVDGVIDDDSANVIIAKMLFLDSEEPSSPMHLHLRSPGGHVSSALAIRDTMDALHCGVLTLAIGFVSGVACWLLARGARGHRAATSSARIMLTSVRGPDSTEHQLQGTEKTLVDMLASDTGQPAATILKDMRDQRTFSADAARAYGLIDQILDPAARLRHERD
jgi:ATP-dependent Clp protease protease subunit